MNQKINTILMMGKTGCGKGTQSSLLASKLGCEIFSTGDEFRKLRKQEDFLGELVRSYYDTGLLMPHWFASYFFENALLKLKPTDSLVCEGVGRKEPEAVLFDEVISWLKRPYIVFELVVSDEEVIRRMMARDRGDGLNDLEKIKVRLQEYRDFTEPAINVFRTKGKVISIDGSGTPEAIHAEIMNKLTELNENK
jgi:adenylate kinase